MAAKVEIHEDQTAVFKLSDDREIRIHFVSKPDLGDHIIITANDGSLTIHPSACNQVRITIASNVR